MASRYEDRSNPRGWDRDEDEGWGNINRGPGRRFGGSNFGGRQEDYGRGGSGREGFSSGQSFEDRGRYQSGGSQGSWTGQNREDYGDRGGYQGGYGYQGRNRGDFSDDFSGGGMFGGGMGGYSGGGYQGMRFGSMAFGRRNGAACR